MSSTDEVMIALAITIDGFAPERGSGPGQRHAQRIVAGPRGHRW